MASFGTRLLADRDRVFEHNAWDHVAWDAAQQAAADAVVQAQQAVPADAGVAEALDRDAAAQWDRFYRQNANRFFKDRNWLAREFPELYASTGSPRVVLEVGCGAGNTVFPLLQTNPDPALFVHACDYSAEAIAVVRSNPAFDARRCRADVWDLAGTALPPGLAAGSVDVCVLVFVLSALAPAQWPQAMHNIATLLKPGGVVLFRDYGRYDMAQLRFKPGRLLEPNLYARGDGTRVYFFTNEEIASLFSPHFDILQNSQDRRMIVNRKRQLQMFRVWLQGRFRRKAV